MNTEHAVTGAQICEPRPPLSKKLATLEHEVVDTVHGATDVAAQTVDIIKNVDPKSATEIAKLKGLAGA